MGFAQIFVVFNDLLLNIIIIKLALSNNILFSSFIPIYLDAGICYYVPPTHSNMTGVKTFPIRLFYKLLTEDLIFGIQVNLVKRQRNKNQPRASQIFAKKIGKDAKSRIS